MTKDRINKFQANLKSLNPSGKVMTMKRDLADNDDAKRFGIIDFILISDEQRKKIGEFSDEELKNINDVIKKMPVFKYKARVYVEGVPDSE